MTKRDRARPLSSPPTRQAKPADPRGRQQRKEALTTIVLTALAVALVGAIITGAALASRSGPPPASTGTASAPTQGVEEFEVTARLGALTS